MPKPSSDDTPAFTAFPTAVQWSHHIIGPRLRPGDIVVDATAGNGHDTHFLADAVLPHGAVYAFDVQEAAVASTRQALATRHGAHLASGAIQLFHAGHEELASRLPPEHRGHLRAIMFNLGYLPGGDKTLTTRLDTTLSAISQALAWLAADGVLTIVLYPGHPGGNEEAQAVEQKIAALPSTEFEGQRLAYLNFRPTTPFCLAIRRRV